MRLTGRMYTRSNHILYDAYFGNRTLQSFALIVDLPSKPLSSGPWFCSMRVEIPGIDSHLLKTSKSGAVRASRSAMLMEQIMILGQGPFTAFIVAEAGT